MNVLYEYRGRTQQILANQIQEHIRDREIAPDGGNQGDMMIKSNTKFWIES
jgi:hypothetical protein